MSNKKGVMDSAADNIRVLTAAMVERARSGHPGGAMGGADFINVLYSEFLVYDPDNPLWECRDRFFLDPGHESAMLYSVLMLSGKYTMEELKQFRQWKSPTPGHPELNQLRGIENTSGPLGQGHTYAVGAAIAAKFLAAHTGNKSFEKEKIYTYISDGGIQEEISQGAGRIAGHLGLDNLIMFFDSNDIQLSTECSDVISEDTAMKYRSWNWNVIEIDGNDCEAIRGALLAAHEEKERPTLIIGKCIMGKGCRRADGSSYEHDCGTHGAPLGNGAYVNTIKNLGADPENPFIVRPEVAELYEQRRNELKRIVAQRHKEEKEWAEANPEKAKKQSDWFAKRLPEIDWETIEHKPNAATRAGSQTILKRLSERVENMICSSADLCNSDKTDGFLYGTQNLKKGDFSGKFLQAGVSELTMACCCIGISLHGGVWAAMGTFFVFSDYMKPAIRMAALMELPVKFIWTHDAFRVGEDGPTHEPVEQEAQIRLMEKLKNHSGKNSLLVLRPSDVHATTVCWQMAMENDDTPTALIFSRQNVFDPPKGTNYKLGRKGAYLVKEVENPACIAVASGSEVSTLVSASEILQAQGININVVSCPSEGLFFNQPEEYREKILPRNAKIFGLTAGLPVTIQSLVGNNGYVHGLDMFGFSAPYKVLDEKLGFTPEYVAEEIKQYINKK